MNRLSLASLAASFTVAAALAPAFAGTLDEVKKRGHVQCGVSTGVLGFSDRNAQGQWAGFDVDFCKALAAAIFDDASKVSYTPLSAAERFTALREKKVDLLSRNSTWTLDREVGLGLMFAGITYHDGQGFLVRGKPNIASALELDGSKVCVQTGTTSQLNLADFFRANSIKYEEKAFPVWQEALRAFDAGTCDVLTTDQSGLFGERLKLSRPNEAMILPDIISKEPLGPVTRADDLAWYTIVKWVNFALVNAEELGITSENTAEALKSVKPEVRRFTGQEGDLGRKLGLDNAWALRAVKAVGNYAEVYERNVGSKSRLAIPRGLNQLWSMGGILYAPPLR